MFTIGQILRDRDTGYLYAVGSVTTRIVVIINPETGSFVESVSHAFAKAKYL